MTEELLIGLASIIMFGIGAQWLAWRLRLPSILLLLVAGFIAGPVAGLVRPDELLGPLLFPFVSVSVAIILFEGGLTLRFSELPKLRGVIFRLISLGALVTWIVAAVSAHFILDLDWQLSVLLGAILIVTGPTVIGPLLRQIRPRGQVAAALKWEGILIDPVGAVLAVLVFEAILAGEFQQATGAIVSGVLSTIAIGVGLGAAGAGAIVLLLRRHLIPDHLQNGVTLVFVVGLFALSNQLQPEAGLLTVTVMGLILANQNMVSVRHITEFKENLQVLLLGVLFILLAARVEPAAFLQLGWPSLVFIGVLVLLGRPLAILVSTLGSTLSRQERLFMTWMAPRGIVAAAVATIFAFELVEAGHSGAERLVPLTFLVIVATVSLYGLTAGPLARRLDLAEEDPQGMLIVGAHALSRAIASVLADHGFVVRLIDTNRSNVRQGRMEGLDAYYCNALSDDALEKVDYSGIGRLLAMTSNNEVNSLAAIHFPDVFGRSAVYQLPMDGAQNNTSSNTVAPEHLTGRFLFGPKMTYNYLAGLFRDGAVVKPTKLTEAFDYADFQQRHGQRAIPLFLIDQKGKLRIYTTDSEMVPKSGQTLISLVPPAGSPVTAEGTEAVQPEGAGSGALSPA